MNVEQTALSGLLVMTPKVFADDRGHFFEAYSERTFTELGLNDHFVQMNHSASVAGVLRGLHFQSPPFAQSKLVRCLRGKLFDVAVDIRHSSKTYGQWFGCELSVENKKMLYIPRGFAHGFYAIEDCELEYLCGYATYAHEVEGGLRFDDPEIDIAWPFNGHTPLVNERDKQWSLWSEFQTPFADV